MKGLLKTEVYRCTLCNYHESKMIMSGRNPIYRHICHHPEMPKGITINKSIIDVGAEIGESDFTPNWCPERKAK